MSFRWFDQSSCFSHEGEEGIYLSDRRSHAEKFSNLLEVTQQVWLRCQDQDRALGFRCFSWTIFPFPLPH